MDLEFEPIFILWVFHAVFGVVLASVAIFTRQRRTAVIVFFLVLICLASQFVSGVLDARYESTIYDVAGLTQTLELMGQFQGYHFWIVSSQLAAWIGIWIFGVLTFSEMPSRATEDREVPN